jgi:hypothetical protein
MLLVDMLHHAARMVPPAAVYVKYSTPDMLEAAPFLTHYVSKVIGYVPRGDMAPPAMAIGA